MGGSQASKPEALRLTFVDSNSPLRELVNLYDDCIVKVDGHPLADLDTNYLTGRRSVEVYSVTGDHFREIPVDFPESFVPGSSIEELLGVKLDYENLDSIDAKIFRVIDGRH